MSGPYGLIAESHCIDSQTVITDNKGSMFAECKFCGDLMRVYEQPGIHGVAHVECHKDDIYDYSHDLMLSRRK